MTTEQIENYLDIAKDQGFDSVITISNQIPAITGQHPTKVDRRKLRKVTLHHWSWSRVLAEAVLQKEHRGVADPDQAWILGELVRYLEHPRSGALEFDDMGAMWVPVREAVATGTLRPSDKSAPEVAGRFDALLRFTGLQLGRHLGDEVTPALTRKEIADPAARAQTLVDMLCAEGIMRGGVRIPNAVAPLVVTADLRGSRIICHVDIDAPREGRPTTRINWLVRQLKQAPDNIRVEAFVKNNRGDGAAELLRDVRENPALLLQAPGKELRSFRVAMTSQMGTKRGSGRGSFIDSVTDSVHTFYREVVQTLKPWTAAPPKMRQLERDDIERPQTASTALSSQDGQEGPDHQRTDPQPQAGEPRRDERDEQESRTEPSETHSLASVHRLPGVALPE